ncbi:hypothetical protein ACMYR3_11345 [Ampullimonas aquatilis]|uniref:hypothetical protein n=1 Tax=Ampullimonas aquatilis TaxID=1341549 RepID=UPI003C70D9F5
MMNNSHNSTDHNSGAGKLLTAALLNNFFDAGWAIQVLVGDMDMPQFLSSRLARPEMEKHLQVMVDSAKALPEPVCELMPKVDWASWAELDGAIGSPLPEQQTRVWEAIDQWLPPTGHYLNQYRARMSELFTFRLDAL